LEEERRAAMDDSWKQTYDERLNSWKAENAARREQSEKTRQEWEKRRSQDLDASSYSMPPSAAHSSMASSFVDARDLVAGEGEGGHGTRALDVCISFSSYSLGLFYSYGLIGDVSCSRSFLRTHKTNHDVLRLPAQVRTTPKDGRKFLPTL
jgi:hypothetical protein